MRTSFTSLSRPFKSQTPPRALGSLSAETPLRSPNWGPPACALDTPQLEVFSRSDVHSRLPTCWPLAPFPSLKLCSRSGASVPISILAQIQSLITATIGHRNRLTVDIFAGPSNQTALLQLRGFVPHPPRRWDTLWFPQPTHARSCAALALATRARGVFIGQVPPKGPPSWLDILGPPPGSSTPCPPPKEGHPYLWHVDIVPLDPGSPALIAVAFDAGLELQNRALFSRWHPALFPLRPLPWFDAIPFPNGIAPPFPLLAEELIPSAPPPPPATLPTGRIKPRWLKPALAPSKEPFPEHDPTSPLLGAFREKLAAYPLHSQAFQAFFLHGLEFGQGLVSPTGSDTHRSEPPNNPKTIPHADRIRDIFLKLTATSPPQAYGPHKRRPAFPRVAGGPQPIVNPLNIVFQGEKWAQAVDLLSTQDKLLPGYPKATGQGKPRIAQNASAPLPSGSQQGWSLNSRLYGPTIRQVYSSHRTLAELITWFGTGTRVIQTDFPGAYKLNRQSTEALAFHVSATFTKAFGLEFWTDAAGIFGSAKAPDNWETFVIPFEHIVRHSSPLLKLTFHYVDNMFTVLPLFLLGPPEGREQRVQLIEKLLHQCFESFPTPHHDDHAGDPFPGLGFHWSSVPTPAGDLKPAKAAVLRAILTALAAGTPINLQLATSTAGLVTWLAQAITGYGSIVPHLGAYLAAAKKWHPQLAPVPQPLKAMAIRMLIATAPSRSPGPLHPSSQLKVLPLLNANPSFAAVMRSDASPHYGCGGYSLSTHAGYHAPWDHPPQSPEADEVSSSLAEAIAALILFWSRGVPGLNLLQTDSDPLFWAFSKGYSPVLLINEAICLINEHARSIGASLVIGHILRDNNQVADALASNQASRLIQRLLALELGPSAPATALAHLSTPSASQMLRLLRANRASSGVP